MDFNQKLHKYFLYSEDELITFLRSSGQRSSSRSEISASSMYDRSCLYVTQITLAQLNSSVPQRHQRQLSTVHLAGLSIITYTHLACRATAISRSRRRQRNSSVLMNAFISPDALLPTGFGAMTRGSAGCITHIIHDVHVDSLMASHSLK